MREKEGGETFRSHEERNVPFISLKSFEKRSILVSSTTYTNAIPNKMQIYITSSQVIEHGFPEASRTKADGSGAIRFDLSSSPGYSSHSTDCLRPNILCQDRSCTERSR